MKLAVCLLGVITCLAGCGVVSDLLYPVPNLEPGDDLLSHACPALTAGEIDAFETVARINQRNGVSFDYAMQSAQFTCLGTADPSACRLCVETILREVYDQPQESDNSNWFQW